jgi:hypothetical protein
LLQRMSPLIALMCVRAKHFRFSSNSGQIALADIDVMGDPSLEVATRRGGLPSTSPSW